MAYDIFSTPDSKYDVLESPNDRTDPLGIFKPSKVNDLFPEKKLTEKQQAELAATQRAKALEAEQNSIIDGVLNSSTWLNSSFQRKYEIADRFNEKWGNYAKTRYDDLESLEALEAQNRMFTALTKAAKNDETRRRDASSLGAVAHSIEQGADRLYDTAIVGLPAYKEAVGIKLQDSRIEQAEKNITNVEKYFNFEDDESRTSSIENLKAELEELKAEQLKKYDRAFEATMKLGKAQAKTRQNWEEAKAANAWLENWETRQAEFSEQGSDSPWRNTLTDSNVTMLDRVGFVTREFVKQAPNSVPSILAGVMTTAATAAATGGNAPAALAAGVASGAAVNAFMLATADAAEVGEQILTLPSSVLQQFPEYGILAAQGLTEDQIKVRMANAAMVEALPAGAAIGAVSALLGPEGIAVRASLGPLIGRMTSKGLFRKVGTAALQSGLSETAEETLEHLNVNAAFNKATGDNSDIWEGWQDPALIGFMMGGITGGALEATGAGVRRLRYGPAPKGDGSAAATPAPGTDSNIPTDNPLVYGNTTEEAMGKMRQAVDIVAKAVETDTVPDQATLNKVYEAMWAAEQGGVDHNLTSKTLQNFQKKLKNIPPDYAVNFATQYDAYVANQQKAAASTAVEVDGVKFVKQPNGVWMHDAGNGKLNSVPADIQASLTQRFSQPAITADSLVQTDAQLQQAQARLTKETQDTSREGAKNRDDKMRQLATVNAEISRRSNAAQINVPSGSLPQSSSTGIAAGFSDMGGALAESVANAPIMKTPIKVANTRLSALNKQLAQTNDPVARSKIEQGIRDTKALVDAASAAGQDYVIYSPWDRLRQQADESGSTQIAYGGTTYGKNAEGKWIKGVRATPQAGPATPQAGPQQTAQEQVILTAEEQEIADAVAAASFSSIEQAADIPGRITILGDKLSELSTARTVSDQQMRSVYVELIDLERVGVPFDSLLKTLHAFQDARSGVTPNFVKEYISTRANLMSGLAQGGPAVKAINDYANMAAVKSTKPQAERRRILEASVNRLRREMSPSQPVVQEQTTPVTEEPVIISERAETKIKEVSAQHEPTPTSFLIAELLALKGTQERISKTISAIIGSQTESLTPLGVNVESMVEQVTDSIQPTDNAVQVIEKAQKTFIGQALNILRTASPGLKRRKMYKQLSRDMNTLAEFCSLKSWEDWNKKADDKTAKAFGRYFREGVSPAKSLQNIFEKLKAFVLRVFTRASAQGKPLTDDVRRVFDRQLMGYVTNATVRQANAEGAGGSAEAGNRTPGPGEANAGGVNQPTVTSGNEGGGGDTATTQGAGVGGTAQQNAGAVAGNLLNDQPAGGGTTIRANSGPDYTGISAEPERPDNGQRGVGIAPGKLPGNDQRAALAGNGAQPGSDLSGRIAAMTSAIDQATGVETTSIGTVQRNEIEIDSTSQTAIVNTVRQMQEANMAIDDALNDVADTFEIQDEERVNKLIDSELNDGSGNRLLAQFYAPQGASVDLINQAFGSLNPSVRELVSSAWDFFKNNPAVQTETMEDVAYLKQTFETAVINAVIDSARDVHTDPWHVALSQDVVTLNALMEVRNKLFNDGVALIENQLVPVVINGNPETTIDVKANESTDVVSEAVMNWLKNLSDKVWARGKKVLIIDRNAGWVYIMQNTGKKPVATKRHPYLPGRAYGDGTTMGSVPADPASQVMLTVRVTDAEGNTVTRNRYVNATSITDGKYTAKRAKVNTNLVVADGMITNVANYQSELSNNFSGLAVFVDSRNDINGQLERTMLREGNEELESPVDAVSDTTPGTTNDEATNGTDVDSVIAQGVIEASQDHDIGSDVQPGSLAVDKALWDGVRNALSDLNNNIVRPTPADTDTLSVEGSPYGESRPDKRSDSQADEAIQVREAAETIAAMVTEEGNPEANLPPEPMDVRLIGPEAAKLRENIKRREDAIKRGEGKERTAFSKQEYGQERKVRWLRNFFNFTRKNFVDHSSEFIRWVSEVDPVTNGMYDDHSAIKAQQLAMGRTAAVKQELYDKTIVPISNFVRRVANDTGISTTQVFEDLGYNASYIHMLEALPHQRTLMQNELLEAMAAPVSDEQNALINKLQEQLDKFDLYMTTGRPEYKVNTFGGLSVYEINQLLKTLRSKYSQAVLNQSQKMFVDGFENTYIRRMEEGSMFRSEVEEWIATPYLNFVSLTIAKDSTRAADAYGNSDGTIFNPARDHKRNGSKIPAEHAGAALLKLINRASFEIGGKDFKAELFDMYGRLKDRGNTWGMQVIPMSQIEPGSEIDTANGFIHRVEKTRKDGTKYIVPYKISWLSSKNADGTVNYKGSEVVKAVSIPAELPKVAQILSIGPRLIGQQFTRFRLYFAPMNNIRTGIEYFMNSMGRDYRTADGQMLTGRRIAQRMAKLEFKPSFELQFLKAFILGDTSSMYGAMWDDFKNSGAYYTFNRDFNALSGKQKKILLDKMSKIPGINLATTGGKFMLDKLNLYNDYFNIQPMFLAYTSMRELGMTNGDAAAWSLDMFNMQRKGAATRWLSVMAPFVNSISQSSYNMFRNMGFYSGVGQSKAAAARSWATFTGLVMGFSMVLPFLRGMAGEDENGYNRMDTLPMNRFMTYMPIFTSDGDHYKLPVGFTLSQLAWNTALGVDRMNRGITTGDEVMKLLAISLAKNAIPDNAPLYSIKEAPAEWLVQTFTPITFKPLVDVAVNRDNFGMQINYASNTGEKAKANQGRHRTAKAWHDMAKSIYKNTGFDFAPEQVRTFVNGYLPGALQGIVAWLEQDNVYKNPEYESTRSILGPIGTTLGLTAAYAAKYNISTTVFYQEKEKIMQSIRQAGVDVTSRENSGNRQKANEYAAKQLAMAGFSARDIQKYILVKNTESDLKSMDIKFRNATEGMRSMDNPSDALELAYSNWQVRRNALQKKVIRQLSML